MGWYHEFQALLKTALGQLTNSSHVRPPGSIDTREPYFTKNFHAVAHARGLTEADALKEAERRFHYSGRTGDVRAWVTEQQANGMLFGSAEHAAEKLSESLAAGASRWYLQIVPTPSDELLQMIATEIVPRVRA